MEVYWLEQTLADVPPGNDWLSDDEFLCLSSLRFLKRRTEWRLGRWTAKCALSSYLNLAFVRSVLATIEIRPAPSGAPEVFLKSDPANVSISLSHRGDRALCVVMPSGVRLGCDLESIEPRSAAFLSDYFTSEEQQLIAHAPAEDMDSLLTLLWSGKESALKALQAGLRLATNDVIVSLNGHPFEPDRWCQLQVRHIHGQLFDGWWLKEDNFVRTLVADSQPDCPIPLWLNPAASAECA